MLEIAAVLITLHTTSGTAVEVNPGHVTHLRNPEPGIKQLTPGTRCLLNMTDGRFIAVIETCDDVRKAMGQK